MKSDTKKDFVLVTDIGNNKFYEKLRRKTGFERDKRIKFVGTVYEQELLKKIRRMRMDICMGMKLAEQIPVCWKHLEIQKLIYCQMSDLIEKQPRMEQYIGINRKETWQG